MEKDALRKELLSARRELTAEQVSLLSMKIVEHIKNTDYYLKAHTIALYHPYRNEVDLCLLLADKSRRYLFPSVQQETKVLTFRQIVHTGQLIQGYKGIYEPSAEIPPTPLSEIDLFLVPGVAYSKTGERIGYGGGYYDATLKYRRAGVPAVGAAFEIQIVSDGFSQHWDQRVDALVTETGVYHIPTTRSKGDLT